MNIAEQLRAVGLSGNETILMHSSMRAIAHRDADELIDCFKDYFKSGLFCIPTHTWAFLDDEYVLDLQNPKTCIGCLPNHAIIRQDAFISMHPTHSMAVFGGSDRAEDFIKEEIYSTTPTPINGCYGKICTEGGYILLAGVKHNRNTYIHAIEEMLGVPNRLSDEYKAVKIRDRAGKVYDRSIRPHKAVGIGDVSLNYVKYEEAFRYHGVIKDCYIGNAKSMLCDAKGMKEVVTLIRERSEGMEILSDPSPLQKELYI